MPAPAEKPAKCPPLKARPQPDMVRTRWWTTLTSAFRRRSSISSAKLLRRSATPQRRRRWSPDQVRGDEGVEHPVAAAPEGGSKAMPALVRCAGGRSGCRMRG